MAETRKNEGDVLPHDRKTGFPWEYVPLKQYAVPPAVTTEAVRMGLVKLLVNLLSPPVEDDLRELEELQAVPENLIDKIFPVPDLGASVSALKDTLDGWIAKEKKDDAIRCVVTPPYSWTAPVIKAWARESGWRVVKSPTPEEILDSGEWFSNFVKIREPNIVIPRLERYYLRHAEGLGLMRKLMEWLWTGTGRCVIGCDGWAWAYLCRAFGTDALFPAPLTLRAFDHARLKTWFQSFPASSGKKEFSFRQADNHKPVLPVPKKTENPDGEIPDTEQPAPAKDEHVTNFMEHLASGSLGIPGVAWAIWRNCLQLLPEAAKSDTDLSRTLWVKPWAKVSLPKTLPRTTHNLFVLHACLLHGGLTANTLQKILPLSNTEISQALTQMKTDRIVGKTNGRWRVTALAYPAVRKLLKNEGYLIDAMGYRSSEYELHDFLPGLVE